jgi:ribosomal protein L29
MKKKDREKLRQMKSEDLRNELGQSQKKLQDFMIHRSVRTVKNVREGREMRKKIAVIRTILREGELTHG